MASIKTTQEKMMNELVARVVDEFVHFLDDRQIGGGELTEGRLSTIVDTAVGGRMDALIQMLMQRLEAITTAAKSAFESSSQVRRSGVIAGGTESFNSG